MDLDTLADDLRRITVEVTSAGRIVGAGVVWGREWIVTNAHVITHPRVMVRAVDHRAVEGLVVARDRTADLAVLRVPDLGLPTAAFTESETIRVGALVFAVGHPYGMRGALTMGVVHATGPITDGGARWIQADLRLGPGNSGGPLADARGRVVGVNAMIAGGIALAISASEVRRFVSAVGRVP